MIVNGKSIYVKLHRSNRSDKHILLIHGGPGESCITFRYFIEELIDFVNVVEVDQSCCGRSPMTDGASVSVKAVIDDYDLIRRELSIEKWSVLGHSFGGFLALEYAKSYPDTIDKIILENPAINLYDSLRCIIFNYFDYFTKSKKYKYFVSLIKALFSKNVVKMLDTINQIPNHHKREFWGNNFLDKKSEELLSLDELTDKQRRNSLMFFNKIKLDADLLCNGWKTLSAVNNDVILLHGEYDKIINSKIKRKFLRKSNAEFIEVAESGHYIHLANITEMCKVIRNFEG